MTDAAPPNPDGHELVDAPREEDDALREALLAHENKVVDMTLACGEKLEHVYSMTAVVRKSREALLLLAAHTKEQNENRGPVEYEVERLTILHREAHAALDGCGIPRSARKGDDSNGLRNTMQRLKERFLAAHTKVVTAEEIELLTEQAEVLIHSYDSHVIDRKQPTEWHEGKKLLVLADKLRAALD